MIETNGHLSRRPVNHAPLTPLDLLARTLEIYPERPAVIWRERGWSYGEFGAIVGRMMAWLRGQGVGVGDVVSVMAGNRPEMLAAHFAIPAVGAVLNAINIRLDVDTVGYILEHGGAKLILADPERQETAEAAAQAAGVPFFALPSGPEAGDGVNFLAGPAPALGDLCAAVGDEWQPISLNYTSGTTGRPKGVVYHHRGAYLNALGNLVTHKMDENTVYLWTLPMFHCNGWCHTWALTAAAALHVCLDKVDPAEIFRLLEAHDVNLFACAPVVLYALANYPDRPQNPPWRATVATGGAAPTAVLIEQMDALGFDLMHLYGLTESYGPATLCVLTEEERQRSATERAQLLARQGVRHMTASRVAVVTPQGAPVPADGKTMGEIALSGRTLMAGYLDAQEATETAFKDDRFHTGDLAVFHPSGAIEIKDRAKDIIISGGENVSSLEVEGILDRHEAVLMSAVVAAPDPKWGEIPCAFVELKPGETADEAALDAFCREHLAGFKVPRRYVFQDIPKTATGKIQKFALRQKAAG